VTDPHPPGEEESEQAYVDAIMDREPELAQRKPAETPKRSRLPILIGLVVFFVPLLGWNVYRMIAAPDPFTSAEQEAAASLSIYLTVHELQLHKDSTGTFPATLAELALDDENLQYIRSGDGYSLTATWNGGVVAFRSGDDLTPFAEALDVFVVEEGS